METGGKPIHCRAAVCRNAGEAQKIEQVIVAPPKTREVRIKIICTSLCHSDVIVWKMNDAPGGLFPRIFGHKPLGVGAALKTAKVEAGSTVAIFGMGCIGLAVAEGARISRAARIIGIDLNLDQFELGKKFGVTDFVNPSECNNKPSEVIKKMTNGGADYCFECVGIASIVHEAFASCRKGWGKTIVLGVDPKSQISFSSFEVLHSGKTIMGSFYGGLKPKSDIPLLLQRYMNKELNLDDFVTHEVGFEDVNKAFDLLLGGESLRCVIWMDR